MNVLMILGNQLFAPEAISAVDKTKAIVFMREDAALCTHFKYHKHKIIFFLSAMRKYSQELREAGFQVHYEKLGSDSKSYTQALTDFLTSHKAQVFSHFEIEDKFFEKQIQETVQCFSSLEVVCLASPMFLTSREHFASYLKSSKKPFMKTFYEGQRKRMKILLEKDGTPRGGRWSFDDENRLSLPADYTPPKLSLASMDATDREVAEIVDRVFAEHPGRSQDYWLPSDRSSAQKWLRQFLEERLANFGPYEDALSPQHPFINHSVLTPFLNVGLLTPEEVVKKTLQVAEKKKIPLNSVEGFIRQIVGWREFIRGIYQNFSERQETTNFWNHQRKLKPCWYEGKTGIDPLDDVIRKTLRYGYAHHIERLMVVGSLMLLLEVHPEEAHRWFMEMFVDSSDWVMGPNVYGMAIFSDGGVFATKPYICGSNYYRKMGPYKKGDWQEGVDGLYWGFIDRNRAFFSQNPRLSMMVKTLDKMNPDKKKKILAAAQELKLRLTSN